MTFDECVVPAVAVALSAPALAFLVLLAAAGIGSRPREAIVGGVVRAAYTAASSASLVAALAYVLGGMHPRRVDVGTWFGIGAYGFQLGLGLDGLSLTYLALVGFLSAVVGGVSHRYLHREEGYRRFFLLLTLFSTGMGILVVADSLDLLIVGWELVGLGSALLIAFYEERDAPTRHGLLAYAVYRVCDVGVLSAAILLHHLTGAARLPISGEAAALSAGAATSLGLLLLFGSMGKSGQLPFSGWLPRAMEGPTTSSAIFYGALSVHAGPYLLLRTAPLWQGSIVVCSAIGLVGGATALHASVVGRVQTDAKTALAYATLSQLGLIYVEIALGLHALALAHVAGNALLRTLQILRAPSIIADHERIENLLGRGLPRSGVHLERLVPEGVRCWLYRFALERGYLDATAAAFIVRARLALLALDRADRRTIEIIGRTRSRRASAALHVPPAVPELGAPSGGASSARGDGAEGQDVLR
jgi:NADH:ubiquinone oxidoreductase subunit 5 (subunit L)/multisubunit Na+/H+ antiporter MnhA subunit